MKFFYLFFCFCLLACDKKPDPAPVSKTDHLTASPWMYQSAGIDSNRDGTIDIAVPPGFAPGCRIDNTLSFQRNNTGVTDEGASKCNTGDAQTTPFNWSFADAEASVVVGNNIFTVLNGKFKLLTLSATSFSLTKDTVIAQLSAQPVALVVNLKH